MKRLLWTSAAVFAASATTAAGDPLLPYPDGAQPVLWFTSSTPSQALQASKRLSEPLQVRLDGRYGTATLSAKARGDPASPTLARLDTSLTTRVAGQRETLRLGDSLARAGTWGRPVRFAGLHYGNALEEAPIGNAAQFRPAARSDLRSAPPSPTNFRSAASGAMPAIAPMSPLQDARARSGLVDHAYAIGFLRSNYGLDGDRYGPLFAAVRLGHPLSERVTAELRAGAQRRIQTGGVALVLRLPRLGTVTAATASSHSDAGTGLLSQTGFDYRAGPFAAALSFGWASPEFRQLGAGDDTRAPRIRSLARASLHTPDRGEFAMSYLAEAYGDTAAESVQGTYRFALADRTSVTLGVSRTVATAADTSLWVSLTLPLERLARALGSSVSFAPRTPLLPPRRTLPTLARSGGGDG